MLSGREIAVVEGPHDIADHVVQRCCRRLGITSTGTEALVLGTAVVPATAKVRDWPGIKPRGEVSEYQLVVGAQ
eukprot:2199719-Amphidinium_carterae.1